MKENNRVFIFEKETYTKEEVMSIVGEVIEESICCPFTQYTEVYVNEKDFRWYDVEGEDYDLVYSFKKPNIIIHDSVGNYKW